MESAGMTDAHLRQHALIELVRAQLVDARAGRVLKQCVTHVTFQTADRVFKGYDCKLSTLADIAESLDCDLVITIQKRPAA
jgi:hypothetical protein